MNLETLGWEPSFNENFKQYREEGYLPARVAVEQKSVYWVYCEAGELQAKISGKYRYNASVRSDYPAVGDWVAVKVPDTESKAVIHGVLPRKSAFSRKLPVSGGKKFVKYGGESFLDGGLTEEQVLAANIDTICIVIGLDQNFRISRIERYLTIAYNSGASPVVVLNKKDLCDDVEEKIGDVDTVSFGAPVHAVSALSHDGLDIFEQYLTTGKTLVFLGSSGVGKSTIINGLLGYERQKVNEVSEAVGKGRHTTTYRELILHPAGGIIIDTPGLRELQIWGDEKDVSRSFGDIEELFAQCRFRNCQHKAEPGCAVKEAMDDGSLDKARYKSYLKQKWELEYLALKKSDKARLIEKTKIIRIMGKLR